MFTMFDLAEVKAEIFEGRGSDLYTPQKSELCFDLSLMSPLDRGTACEKLICKIMNRHGIDATHMGGSGNRNDISLYVGGKIVRGEVKSSLLGPQSGKYYFVGVKPELFDVLFLTFVTPEGIVVKTASSASVKRWVAEYNPKNKAKQSSDIPQYDIYFKGDMTNGKIPTIEWDPSAEGTVKI